MVSEVECWIHNHFLSKSSRKTGHYKADGRVTCKQSKDELGELGENS